MSVNTTMYRLPPVNSVEGLNIRHTDNMYKLPPLVNQTELSNDSSMSGSKENSCLTRLQRLDNICTLLLTSMSLKPSTGPTTKVDTPMSMAGKLELAVHANDEKPPIALFASLASLASSPALSDQCHFNVHCYTHSSVMHRQLNNKAVELTKFANNELSVSTNGSVSLEVRVIWKKVSVDCWTILNAFSMTPLYGEVLAFRALLVKLNLQLTPELNNLISAVDAAILAPNPNLNRERQALLKRLAKEPLLVDPTTRANYLQSNAGANSVCLLGMVDAFVLGALCASEVSTPAKGLPQPLVAWKSSLFDQFPYLAKLIQRLEASK